MKIIIIGSKNFDSLEFHLSESLNYLGHTAEIIDYHRFIPALKKYEYWIYRFSESYAMKVSINISRDVIEKKPDLVIVTYRDVHPSFVKIIKQNILGVKIAHLNPDQLTTLQNQQIFASDYDFYFSKDKYMVSFMKDKISLNAYYLPECFNQRFTKSDFADKKSAEESLNIDVLVYGNFYAYRNIMLENLVKHDINIKIYGNKGPFFPKSLDNYFNGPIFGKEKVNCIKGAKIVFNNFHYAEVNSVNEKYFVINGFGGFQICDYRAVLDDYSTIKSEIYSFRTINEAVEKIKYFLSNPSLRYDIAVQQQQYFMQNHTYDIRMQQMLKIIFD